ncbi:MAG: hypothetical protein EWV86_00420 [Microcystis panniformis Mp_MB_F_20051200_S9D]|nr:MAG: hypothetical protein EWV86_00420 [Microcystis panniformis Mp_MB_F_20051200_S9D]
MRIQNYLLTLLLFSACGQRENTNTSETAQSDSLQFQETKQADSLRNVQEITEYIDLKENISEDLKRKQESIDRQIKEQERNLILHTTEGLRLYEKGVNGDLVSVLSDSEFKPEIIDKILPLARRGYHIEKAYQIALGKIREEDTDPDEWVIGNEEEFESTYNGPYLIREFKKSMTDSARQGFKYKRDSLNLIKADLTKEIETINQKLITVENKYEENLESMISNVKYHLREQRIEAERDQMIKQQGTYSYEDSSGKFEITVNGNKWGGQITIKSGYGDSYDRQNAEYEFGVVKGNILYERSGYSQIGYIKGNRLYSSLGDKQITLIKK